MDQNNEPDADVVPIHSHAHRKQLSVGARSMAQALLAAIATVNVVEEEHPRLDDLAEILRAALS